MANSVRTGAYAYLTWGLQTANYTTAATNINKVFGFEQKVTSWNYANNRITLAQLNDVFPKTFAFGQTRGSLSVDYVLSSPWFFDLLFPTRSSPTAGTPDTFEYSITSTDKSIQPFTTDIGFDQTDNDNVRRLIGCILNSVTIRSTLDDAVRCTADIQYSREDSSATIPTTKPNECDSNHFNFPYTFAHGTLEFPDNTGIIELQEVEVTFNQNPELLWGHGDNRAVGAYRRLFEVTGRFKTSWRNMTELNKLYAQTGINNQTQLSVQPTLNIDFDKGTGASQNKIEIKATDLALGEHNVTGIEPNEPVFEDITWQLSGCTVECSSEVAPPSD